MAPSIVQAASLLLFASSAWATLAVEHEFGFEAFRLDKRAPGPSTNLPASWTYQGCYTDGGPRTLNGPSYVNTTDMTIGSCIAFCNTQYYIYAGVEYAQECCKYFCLSKVCLVHS